MKLFKIKLIKRIQKTIEKDPQNFVRIEDRIVEARARFPMSRRC